jgi:Flp pilus assembly protein TadG
MKKPDERGVSAVEFALLLPLLLLILFGIIEFGLILYDKAVITNASREVARAAIALGTNATDIQQIKDDVILKYGNNVFSFRDNSELVSANIVITPTLGCANSTPAFGNPIQINVRYDYTFLVLSPIVGLFGGTWDPNLPIEATTTMRCE